MDRKEQMIKCFNCHKPYVDKVSVFKDRVCMNCGLKSCKDC